MKNSDPMINDIKQSIDEINISKDEHIKLIQAREKALNSGQSSTSTWFKTPVIAYASIVLVVCSISYSLYIKPNKMTINPTQFEQEFALMQQADLIAMSEDLEFYMWLDINEKINKKDKPNA